MITTVAVTESTNDSKYLIWPATASRDMAGSGGTDGIISWGSLCSSGHCNDEGGSKVVDVRKGASIWASQSGRGTV